MESKYFTTDVCKCMHAMYDMHDPNTGAHDPNSRSSVEQNYVCSSECENNVLHQHLPNLSLEYFKVGTPGARASNVVPLVDHQTRGWSSWPDTRAHDLLNFLLCYLYDP